MTNVWKIGSRWGNNGESVLDLFLRYGCVFFGGKDDRRVGRWRDVRPGDLFIVSSGSVPVAIGEALGAFKSYDDIGFDFDAVSQGKFIDANVRICDALLVPLRDGDSRKGWRIDGRKRFCRAWRAAQKAHSFWTVVRPPERVVLTDASSRLPTLLEEIGSRMADAIDCARSESAVARACEIARFLKAKGTALDVIAEATGLTNTEVSAL